VFSFPISGKIKIAAAASLDTRHPYPDRLLQQEYITVRPIPATIALYSISRDKKRKFDNIACMGPKLQYYPLSVVRDYLFRISQLQFMSGVHFLLSEEHRLRMFENRVLRRIFGPKRDEVMGGQKNYIIRSFITCTSQFYC
jgi:hypothetical protein